MPNVEDFMSREVGMISRTASVLEAARVMTERDLECVVVVENSKPMGIVTEKDVLTKVIAQGVDPARVAVSEVMSTPIITINPDSTLRTAARIMGNNKIRKLVVIRDGKVVGILTAKHITSSIIVTIARTKEESEERPTPGKT